MTVEEALETPVETCPDQVCQHDVAIRGRRLCTFPRDVLILFAIDYAKKCKELHEEQRQQMAREGKISPRLYGPDARLD